VNQPKVSIIILNWNGLPETSDCLGSLKEIVYKNYDVIVVDNGSEGQDVRVLRDKLGDYIHVIENDRNYGFAEGNNIGIRYAASRLKPEYFLLLNNDTVVAQDFLDELVKVAESEAEIGIVGPKIYYYDFGGRKDVIWFAGGKIAKWRRWIYHGIGWNDDDLPQYQDISNVDWVSGAAMMLKRSVIERISYLDSHYFFGDEDVDYCLRARRHGFKIVYAPTARVWHKVGMSRWQAEAAKNRLEPSFVNLYSYYRLIRKNFYFPVYVYHLGLLPPILFQWGISYLVKRRDKETLVEFLKSLVPGRLRPRN
jgi:hypothetical protein